MHLKVDFKDMEAYIFDHIFLLVDGWMDNENPLSLSFSLREIFLPECRVEYNED